MKKIIQKKKNPKENQQVINQSPKMYNKRYQNGEFHGCFECFCPSKPDQHPRLRQRFLNEPFRAVNLMFRCQGLMHQEILPKVEPMPGQRKNTHTSTVPLPPKRFNSEFTPEKSRFNPKAVPLFLQGLC